MYLPRRMFNMRGQMDLMTIVILFRQSDYRSFKDFLHKESTKLAKTKSVITIENLDVKKMLKASPLTRHIADAS